LIECKATTPLWICIKIQVISYGVRFLSNSIQCVENQKLRKPLGIMNESFKAAARPAAVTPYWNGIERNFFRAFVRQGIDFFIAFRHLLGGGPGTAGNFKPFLRNISK
jgi:hypothetical protein